MRARLLTPTLQNLTVASLELRHGKTVAVPTETVYGLAANALDADACARIFAAKERPHFDPLIVHVLCKNLRELEEMPLVDWTRVSPRLREVYAVLTEAFWPGPLTLLFPRDTTAVPDLVTSGLETVALRSPAHPVMRHLLQLTERPLAAPSANRFGRISPTSAKDVEMELGDRIEWIIDGGPCAVGVESTVAAFENETLRVLRPGGVSLEALQDALIAQLGAQAPRVEIAPLTVTPSALASPGQLASHYAPRKRLVLFDEGSIPPLEDGAAVLALTGEASRWNAHSVRVLSPKGDLAEAARKLFATLRELDASDASVIYAERPVAPTGLGFAILDRLTRAAAPKLPHTAPTAFPDDDATLS